MVRIAPAGCLAAALVLGACSNSSSSSTTTTSRATRPPTTTVVTTTAVGDDGGGNGPGRTDPAPPTTVAGSPWRIDTTLCPDPAQASAPITGTVKLAMAAPLSGGVAAAAAKPIVDAVRAYVEAANARNALGDVKLELRVTDDAFDPDRTKVALQGAIDQGAEVVVAVVGSANNVAARFTLNEQCIPQLFGIGSSTGLGHVAEFPWTTGVLPVAGDDLAASAPLLRSRFPKGATMAVYSTDDELGKAYVDAAKTLAPTLGIDVVATQAVPDGTVLPATAQIDAVAAPRPDVVLVATQGVDCAYVLKGLATRRNDAPGWQPTVITANACASRTAMALAGVAADGAYSTSNLIDVDAAAAPNAAANPAITSYLDQMAIRGLRGEADAGAVGWTAAEAAVTAMAQAQQSSEGLSRASIMTAARHLDYVPSLGRPGVRFRTDGDRDPFIAQSLQVIRWTAAAGTFVDVGATVTTAER